MNMINSFNYCALIILIVLIVMILSRRMLNGRKNRYFWNLLLVILCGVVFDILAVNLDGGPGDNVTEKYVAHGGYLILHSLSAPVYVIYLACLAGNMYKLREKIAAQVLLAMPFVCVLAMVLVTPVTHGIFYIDEYNRYIRGDGYWILYIAAAFYVGVGVVYALRCRRLFSKGQFLSMLAVFPLMLAAFVVQLFHPQLRIEMFAHVMGVLFLLLMVQRPMERMNLATSFGRDTAYAADIEQAVYNGKPLRIILIHIVNYKALQDVLGYASMQELTSRVSENIMALCKAELPKVEPYYLDRGRFCLVVGKESFQRVDRAAEALNEMLRKDISMQDMGINLQANLCIIRFPEDMGDFQGIFTFSNEFEEHERTGKVLYAEEILKDGRYIIKDIEAIIDDAMTNEGLSVYYQPIYSVESGKFVSAEALIRLDNEEYGHISPELFIPVAEKNGVIHKIGFMVLEEVCKFIASDTFRELGLEYIEVNLSVTQCMRSNLAKEILALLERYHVRPDQLNLEITETAVAYSQNVMTENIRVLAEAGIPFSLDDFGTGYSNLSRVAQMPLSIVKLDKSFTKWESNPGLEIIVRNAVKMVKELNMKIVVEGIETKEQSERFAELACDYIQGFYYSRPLTKEAFVQFLRKQAQQRLQDA